MGETAGIDRGQDACRFARGRVIGVLAGRGSAAGRGSEGVHGDSSGAPSDVGLVGRWTM